MTSHRNILKSLDDIWGGVKDEEIRKRFEAHFGDERDFAEGQIPYLREKLSSLSEFMREIKIGFARFYNRRHNRRGYFWGDRFKSVIVDKGKTLVICLAYFDLNPLRAGLVERPEQYPQIISMVQHRPVTVATTPPGFSHSGETNFPRHE